MLERAAVEQERRSLQAEQGCGLVEDSGRNSDGAPLGALAGERELERIELEVGGSAQRERHHDLEGPRGTESGAPREIGVERALDPNRGTSESGEFLGDARHITAPTTHLAAPVRRELDRFARRAELDAFCGLGLKPDAELDRDREDEPAAVVGVLADQVDASGRPETESHGILRLCLRMSTRTAEPTVEGRARRRRLHRLRPDAARRRTQLSAA
jgi:hypothetical protein